MSVWKPHMWKKGSYWWCSYYRNYNAGVYYGSTPSQAYAAWKWRNERLQKSLPPLSVTA